MLNAKSEFQKLVMTKEVLREEIINEFTQTLIVEVEKQMKIKGKEEYLKSLE